MCKRNSPDKNEASVRETPQIKNKLKKSSQQGMRKRNSANKNKANMGYVIETLQIKIKPAWDV